MDDVRPIGGGRLTAPQQLRRLGNWANLSTPVGLLIARIGRADVQRGPRGLVLADGYRLGFPIAGAFTVGNVVITARSWPDLLATSPNLLRHEERHSWQYLACLGLPFFGLYAAAMGWSWLRTGDLARANVFERAAGLADGGYL
ncbi:hypothetical protein [Microlunatus soli]|uniref:DUF4157 domain-containing protein n=1 Tax=Microlunatus soli TaxID=630515 RepID=A0A1H1RSB5_9ACTN|nr:hypothetical protein [Microlunatus soli]SDS38590.1 hypothetical protein SAMN04489812_1750 [Microlunatus soli]